MAYFTSLREHITALEANGKLVRVKEPINKDTELHPLVRLQFRGLPEEDRKAWLFENVYDAKGKHYPIPVIVGALGASSQVYAIGMQCGVADINKKWQYALSHPIPPIIVHSGPVQEIVYTDKDLLAQGGFGEFPIPLSTPGFDCAPYITAAAWVTRDPETGIRNVGTYRGHIKAPDRTGVLAAKHFRGIAYHWRIAKKLGQPLPAAIVVGFSPNIGFTSVAQLPKDVDEFTIAGGIAGKPVELVKCKTVDLEVPAHAEIIFEGEISTREIEPEAPFGEACGYVGLQEYAYIFHLKCVTHRKDPIWQSFISQFAPSESSVIRTIGCANVIPKRLKDLNLNSVKQVAVHFSNGSDRYVVIQMRKTSREEVWRALHTLPEQFPAFSKIIVAVDEEINPWDANFVNWAITYRCQPYRDVKIIKIDAPDVMDFSMAPPAEEVPGARIDHSQMPEYSCLLMDATQKWDYPPVSLPTKEYMEGAIQLWEKLGMPNLKLQEPWYGYNLGRWTPEDKEHADLAVKGNYYVTGELLAKRRKPA